MPAKSNFFVETSSLLDAFFFFDRYHTNGDRTAAPIMNLAALNRNGPIVSASIASR